MADPDDVQTFYDRMWQDFGDLDARSPAAFHRRRLIAELVRQHAPTGAQILEVGCGRGEQLLELQRKLSQPHLGGADVSKTALAATRRLVPEAEVFQLDLASHDFEQTHGERLGYYDVVVCSEVLEHLTDDRLAARRLRSLLAPGGHVVLSVPGGTKSRFDEAIGHRRHYSPQTLGTLLVDSGFTELAVQAWGFPFHTLYRSAVRLASRLAMRPEQIGQEGGPRPESMPDASQDGNGTLDGRGRPEAAGPASLSKTLRRLYVLSGRGFKPLFYLNASRWGEQLIAVAKRP